MLFQSHLTASRPHVLNFLEGKKQFFIRPVALRLCFFNQVLCLNNVLRYQD